MFELVYLFYATALPTHPKSRLPGDLWSRTLGFLIFDFWNIFVLHSYQPRSSLMPLAVSLLGVCIGKGKKKVRFQ